jgi:large subunit ribosomal protein L22
MEVRAKAKQIRIAPQKTRLVAGLVRGLEVNKALSQLKFSPRKAAKPLAKLIESGIANAVHNYDLDKDNWFIKEIRIDEGKTLHRWIPKAHGRATPIRKRSSHAYIVLAEIKDSGEKQAKKQEIDAPIKLGTMPAAEEAAAEAKEGEEKAVKKGVRKDGSKGHSKADVGATEGKGFIKKVFNRKSG